MRSFKWLVAAAGILVSLVVAGCGSSTPAPKLDASAPSPTAATLSVLASQEKQLTAAEKADVNAAKVMTNTGGKTSLGNAETDVTDAETSNLAATADVGSITTPTVTVTQTVTSPPVTVTTPPVTVTATTPTTTTATGTTTTATGTTTTGTTTTPSSFTALHVAGNHLQNTASQDVRLIGTDISGTAYACEQNGGYGFSDTPTGAALYAPMAAWHINSVGLALNQDCWLGINGVPAQYSGQNYINFVKAQVSAMEADHIYPVLIAQVGEPGTDAPNWYSTGNGNAPMPDADHYPLWWEEIAQTFKSDPDVIFRLYEEPWPDFYGNVNTAWQCWSSGDVQYGESSDSTLPAGWQSSPGTQIAPTSTGSTAGCGGSSATSNPEQSDGSSTVYKSVGFQSLVNIVRGTGATNVIQVPGIAFANALTCTNSGSPVACGFLQPGIKVTDPLQPAQLMADTDNYPDSGQFMSTTAELQAAYGPVEQVMPVDMGEIGVEGNGAFPLTEQFVDQYDTWGQSYYLSQWESWANLISDYSGTPFTGWGSWAFSHVTG